MKKKLKIGITLNSNEKLQDGHLKIISELINCHFLKLECVIYYKEKKKLNLLSSFLYDFISKVEKKYCLITRKKEQKIIKKYFLKIEKYFFNKNNKNKFFEDSKIKDKLKNIDLLLFFEKNEFIKSQIVNLPKKGSWMINFGVNEFIFAGFWESLDKKNVTKVEIQKIKYTNLKKSFSVIDQGFYSTKVSSWFSNRDFVLEKSAILLMKNIRLLNLKLKKKKQKNVFSKNETRPRFTSLLKYIIKKYPRAFLRKTLLFLFYPNKKTYTEPSHNPWNIHIGTKINNKLLPFKTSTRIKPKNNQAWADPFLISYKKKDYVFFENFEFSKQKGKISFAKLVNNNISEIDDALDLKFHLSYPFLWKEKNNFFMMPETGQKKCVQIWKAVDFPKKWILYKTLFKGQSCVDTNFFDTKNGQRWLFTNKSNDKYNDHNSELYVYKTDKKFNKIIPHKYNPVIIDSRIARNAGNLFYNYKKQIIRPSQLNILNFYGKGLNLRIIKKLKIDSYEEFQFKSYYPNFKKRINAIHHISQNKKNYAIDVRYKNFLSNFIPE
jgi:hypothetical protein